MMFPELNNICDFAVDKLPRGKTLLIGECGADGSFVLHHMASLYLKAGKKVCYVGLAQSFNHYNSVGNKIGVNLANCKELGNLVFIEGLKALTEQSLTAVDSSVESGPNDPFILFGAKVHSSLQNLYNMVKETVLKINEAIDSSNVVIIDDISVLLSLGIPSKDIIFFIQYLRHLINTINSTAGKHGCLVVLCNGADIDDEEIGLLWKQLCYHSHMILKTKGLDSGYCRDVHGQLIVQRKNPSQIFVEADQSTTMQYKISDKNVTFFAPGMSTAVL